MLKCLYLIRNNLGILKKKNHDYMTGRHLYCGLKETYCTLFLVLRNYENVLSYCVAQVNVVQSNCCMLIN